MEGPIAHNASVRRLDIHAFAEGYLGKPIPLKASESLTSLDCVVLDPSFGVYRETGCEDGDLILGPLPIDFNEPVFQVWDAEGSIITQPLPWIDCCWIAHALNAKSDAEVH